MFRRRRRRTANSLCHPGIPLFPPPPSVPTFLFVFLQFILVFPFSLSLFLFFPFLPPVELLKTESVGREIYLIDCPALSPTFRSVRDSISRSSFSSFSFLFFIIAKVQPILRPLLHPRVVSNHPASRYQTPRNTGFWRSVQLPRYHRLHLLDISPIFNDTRSVAQPLRFHRSSSSFPSRHHPSRSARVVPSYKVDLDLGPR